MVHIMDMKTCSCGKKHFKEKAFCSDECGILFHSVRTKNKRREEKIQKIKEETKGTISNELILKLEPAYTYRELIPYKIKRHREPIPTNMRKIVFNKFNNACAKCGETKHLDVHHIIHYSVCKEHEEENLILLCIECHHQEHIDDKRLDFLFNSRKESLKL